MDIISTIHLCDVYLILTIAWNAVGARHGSSRHLATGTELHSHQSGAISAKFKFDIERVFFTNTSERTNWIEK